VGATTTIGRLFAASVSIALGIITGSLAQEAVIGGVCAVVLFDVYIFAGEQHAMTIADKLCWKEARVGGERREQRWRLRGVTTKAVVVATLIFVVVFPAISQASMGPNMSGAGMALSWWFAGAVLIVVSFVVWLAGLKGKEAVLSIGKRTVAESKGRKTRTDVRLPNMFNIIVGTVGISVGLAAILLLAL
jgi:hypothetical protein